jgi:RimJ/RimL family protein N-acetyltransferase
MTIETARLRLIACDLDLLDAYAADRRALGERLGVRFPDDFPVFPEGIAWWRQRLRSESVDPGWTIWFAIRVEDGLVIGDGGFKGAPDGDGVVETGYALVEQARGQGYGSEFVRALIGWAFAHPEVTAVTAETLPDNVASIGLLRSLGMEPTGSYEDANEGTVLRWRLDRAAWTARS